MICRLVVRTQNLDAGDARVTRGAQIFLRRKQTVMPTWTDNRDHGTALNNLISTKFPSSAVLMEQASYMKGAVGEGPRGGSP